MEIFYRILKFSFCLAVIVSVFGRKRKPHLTLSQRLFIIDGISLPRGGEIPKKTQENANVEQTKRKKKRFWLWIFPALLVLLLGAVHSFVR